MAAGVKLSLANFVFEPEELVVTAGTTVLWVNADEAPHTLTSTASPPLFGSKTLRAKGTYSFQFKPAGTYGYFLQSAPLHDRQSRRPMTNGLGLAAADGRRQGAVHGDPSHLLSEDRMPRQCGGGRPRGDVGQHEGHTEAEGQAGAGAADRPVGRPSSRMHHDLLRVPGFVSDCRRNSSS
jgi:hypothetical protein